MLNLYQNNVCNGCQKNDMIANVIMGRLQNNVCNCKRSLLLGKYQIIKKHLQERLHFASIVLLYNCKLAIVYIYCDFANVVIN